MYRELSITRILSLLLLVSMGGLAAACGSDDPPASSLAKIESFQADADLLEAPGEVTLSWRTSGASTLELFRGEEELDLGDAPIAEGAMRVFVEETTDFRLVAADSKRRTVDSRVSVVVDDDGKPLIGSFEAPELIEADASGKGRLTATWEGLRRAETLSLEVQGQQPRSLEVAVDGSAEVEIDGDATLTLRATNEVGETTASVEVRLAKEPVIESFVADRLHVGTGEEVTLSWTTSGAKTVELWLNGTKVDGLDPTFTTGEIAIPIDFDSEIELRAANELGDTESATIEIVVGSPTIEEFEFDAAALWLGETVEVSWLTSGGSQLTFSDVETGEALCEVDQIGAIGEGGCPWTPTAAGVYSLQLIVTNSSGADSESLELVVGTGATIVRFSANPTQLNEGEETVLSWQVLPDPAGNVPALTLRDDLGGNYVAAASEGTIDVPITQVGTRTFTLEATTDDSRSTPAVASADVEVFALPTIFAQATPEHFDDAHADKVVLSWTNDHAVALTIERRATAAAAGPADEIVEIPEGDVAAGSWNFVPAVDTTLRLIATNALGGTTEQEIGVTVAPTDIAQFDVQPRILTQGQPVTISWRTQMSDRVEIEAPGFGETYLVEERAEPYIDLAREGGTRLSLRQCGGAIIREGCATIEFPADFRFPFAGATREKILVHTKGVATFDTEIVGTVGSKQRLPTNEQGAWLHLFPFWDELAWNPEKYPQGNLYWSMIEDERGRGLAIQWKDVGLWADTGTIVGFLDVSINFETILREDGTFEYRYGKFFKRTENLPPSRQHFSNSTIGFQLPDRTDAHELAHAQVVQLLGSAAERTFTYRPLPDLGTDGDLMWFPLGRSNEITVSLLATRGETTRSRSIDLAMERKPLVELRPEVIAPSLVGEDFVFQWKSFNATALWVEDQAGVERCRATQASLEEGACTLSEGEAGVHRYTVKVEGAHGFVTEAIIEATVYGDFGVFVFEADQPSVENGAGITLSWIVFNAEEVVLFRDGVQVVSQADNIGSYFAENIEGETEFTLRAIDEFGVSDEASLTVSIWEILIDLQADRTNVRPGEAVTVTVNARTLDGEVPATIMGRLPLVEVTDPAHRYQTLVTSERLDEGSTILLGRGSMQGIELPFPFPYMGKDYSSATVNLHGYLSFNPAPLVRNNNMLLPDTTSPAVELAPFWDQLILHGPGNYYVGEQDGAFVIEWSKISMGRASAASNLNDLNFQVVLFPDGAFEYRYGKMDPGPGTYSSCTPTTDCKNEAMGSSATIGYAFDSGAGGFTHHFGGQQSGADNPVVSGGLENRTFRYPMQKGAQTFTIHPFQSEDFSFCALSGEQEVCKVLSVQVEFGLDRVIVSQPSIAPGGESTLSWESRGGRLLQILDGDTVLFETEDTAIIDSGSYAAKPTKNTEYRIVLTSGIRHASVKRTVDVEAHRLTAEIGQPSGPGKPVNLSWNLSSVGDGPAPLILTPMEAIEADFYELDISGDPDVDTLIGANNFSATVQLTFKNGFKFPYFGEELSSVYVGVGGHITTKPGSSGNNAELPTTNHAGNLLMPFWDQLTTQTDGAVFAKSLGTDSYVIQWSRMGLRYHNNMLLGGSLNFMVVLHKDGSFEYRYGTMAAPPQPQTNATYCYPASCVLESNGSSATIAYMDPGGNMAQIVHFGGVNRAEGQQPVAGGLTGKAWKFTPRSGSGSMTVHPTETRTYEVCAYDTVIEQLSCAPSMEVDIPWGIDFFTAPSGPLAGEEIDLSWKVMALDSLQLKDGTDVIASYTGEQIPLLGSVKVSPTEPTIYTLVAESMSRTKTAEVTVAPRLFDLVVTGPTEVQIPGEKFVVEWELTSLTDDPIEMMTPLTEIDASPGSSGAFFDIRDIEGAEALIFTNPRGNVAPAGSAPVALPFTFDYLGTAHSKIRVYNHGYLAFDETHADGVGGNKPLPTNGSAAENRVHLAPFWDMLEGRDDGIAHAYSPDPQTLIVQWSRYSHDAGSSSIDQYDLNFQIVLRSNGTFEYRYGKMREPEQPFFSASCGNGDCRDEANGSSATIGYQDVTGTHGSTLHLGSMAIVSLVQEAGAVKPDSYIAFPGGLEGRSFAYQPVRRGSSTITAGQSGNYQVCGLHPAYSACKSVEIMTPADGGDLGITELMIDPAGGQAAQWFEIRNYSRRTIDLEGFEIAANGGSHLIEGTFPIAPGEFKTLAGSNQVSFIPDYVYGAGVPLDRNLDKLALRTGDATIASVKWSLDWAIPRNETLMLEGTHQEVGVQERDTASEWCRGGPLGSPGELGESCLHNSYQADPHSRRPFLDISQTGTRFHEVEGWQKVERLPYSGPPIDIGGQLHNHIWVASYGFISFSDVRPAFSGVNSPPRVPDSQPYGPLISGFWGSQRCDKSVQDCKFLYDQIEVEGQSVLVLQWDNYRYQTYEGSITFQIQLWEDGDVVVAYGDVENPHTYFSSNWLNYRGNSSWIGIEVNSADWSTAHSKKPAGLANRSFSFRRR